MDGRSPRGSLTLVDFLDVALLGTIVLSIGLVLLPPLQTGAPPPPRSVGGTLISIVRALGSVSGPVETIGFLLTIAGSMMVLVGPLWILVGRPLSRRDYL